MVIIKLPSKGKRSSVHQDVSHSQTKTHRLNDLLDVHGEAVRVAGPGVFEHGPGMSFGAMLSIAIVHGRLLSVLLCPAAIAKISVRAEGDLFANLADSVR